MQVQELLPGGAPGWLTAGDGRVVMSVLCVLVVFPLSCLRRMREVRHLRLCGLKVSRSAAALHARERSGELMFTARDRECRAAGRSETPNAVHCGPGRPVQWALFAPHLPF